MKSGRMSEIEDGSEPTGEEIGHAFLFCAVVSVIFGAMVVCMIFWIVNLQY